MKACESKLLVRFGLADANFAFIETRRGMAGGRCSTSSSGSGRRVWLGRSWRTDVLAGLVIPTRIAAKVDSLEGVLRSDLRALLGELGPPGLLGLLDIPLGLG
jgi:hypothetical protein